MMMGTFDQDAYIFLNQIPTASPTNVSHPATHIVVMQFDIPFLTEYAVFVNLPLLLF